ncbi:hypothetical protein RIF29_05034 [Crotalaria pallida]|uniref:Uncharacterized protein n=1 Tax=Crotalaria pallida TaxID=3830 RepID=A0AAN9P9J6_CROPI
MEREENGVLRAQNERLLKENMLMKEILENAKCLACWGLSIEDVEKHKQSLQQLKLENALLKEFQLNKKKKIIALLQEKDPGALLEFTIVAEMEREENDVLHAKNERLLKENMLMKETLENAKCLACWGLSLEDVEKHKHSLQQLKLENAKLKYKSSYLIDEASKLAKRYMEQPMSQPDELQLDLLP